MCTVLLPPGGYPTALNKYVYLSILLGGNLPGRVNWLDPMCTEM